MVGSNTAELYDALYGAHADAGVAFDIPFGAVSALRSIAAAHYQASLNLYGAVEQYRAGIGDTSISADHVSITPWSPTETDWAAAPRYQAHAAYRDEAGDIGFFTVTYETGALPDTAGGLWDDIAGQFEAVDYIEGELTGGIDLQRL